MSFCSKADTKSDEIKADPVNIEKLLDVNFPLQGKQFLKKFASCRNLGAVSIF